MSGGHKAKSSGPKRSSKKSNGSKKVEKNVKSKSTVDQDAAAHLKYAVMLDGKVRTPKRLLSIEPINIEDISVVRPPSPQDTAVVEEKGDSKIDAIITDTLEPEEEKVEIQQQEEEQDEWFEDEIDYEALDAEAQIAKGLSNSDLQQKVTVSLTETSTVTLLSIRGSCIKSETDLHAEVTQRNKAYKELVNKHISNKDLYNNTQCQTLNPSVKQKGIQATPEITKEIGCMATSWDIYDASRNNDNSIGEFLDLEIDSPDKREKEVSPITKEVDEAVRNCLATPGCLLQFNKKDNEEASSGKKNHFTGEEVLKTRRKAELLKSDSLNSSLRLIERLIQQSDYHSRQLAYRGLNPVQDIAAVLKGENVTSEDVLQDMDEDEEAPTDIAITEESTSAKVTDPLLESFWSFKCSSTRDMNVSSMVWNPVNLDLLVVGYNAHAAIVEKDSTASMKSGLVCFWSLKSPEFPERIINVSSGVSAIAFSQRNPFLLAVGLHDGTVAIYDVRRKEDTPMLKSEHGNGKYSSSIWQVKWVDRGQDKGGEVLISISGDGRVMEWSIKKGLEFSQLMLLKRKASSEALNWKPVSGNSEGIISRTAAGLCFDFPVDNSTLYVVGTNDGLSHKCSCSYNEQYLQSFTGHNGPIYRLRCHPMYPGIFLTCSSDCTSKLWSLEQGREECILSFQQTDLTDAVNDIQWSPNNASVFASVASDGRVEIWDLQKNLLRPVITHFTSKVSSERIDHISIIKSRAAQKAQEEEAEELLKLSGKKGSKDIKRIEKLDKNVSNDIKEMVPRKMTCVSFARNAKVLVVGDCLGTVEVYRICGMENDITSKVSQIEKLKATLQAADGDKRR